jgi:hypothetical protein
MKRLRQVLFTMIAMVFSVSSMAEEVLITISYHISNPDVYIDHAKYAVIRPDGALGYNPCTGSSHSMKTCQVNRISNAPRGVYEVRGAVLPRWFDSNNGAQVDIRYEVNVTSSTGRVQKTKHGSLAPSYDAEKPDHSGVTLITFAVN